MTLANLAISEAQRWTLSLEEPIRKSIESKGWSKEAVRAIANGFQITRTLPSNRAHGTFEVLAAFFRSPSCPKLEGKNMLADYQSLVAQFSTDKTTRDIWIRETTGGQTRRCHSALSKLGMFHSGFKFPPFDSYAAKAMKARTAAEVSMAENYYARLQDLRFRDIADSIQADLRDLSVQAERVIDKYLMLSADPKFRFLPAAYLQAQDPKVRDAMNEAGSKIEATLKSLLP
ncbi:hypothetical protein [Vannielia litorea]|uniref:hypothetical protein n=1 Tax=Vannielia litorea TaxID=1217970 RepID=UPI001BCBE82E|nr:hypothetical protein [Vannielia litorea]MBS8226885.1 hypothetical protein [Vannielia litorea]